MLLSFCLLKTWLLVGLKNENCLRCGLIGIVLLPIPIININSYQTLLCFDISKCGHLGFHSNFKVLLIIYNHDAH